MLEESNTKYVEEISEYLKLDTRRYDGSAQG